MSTSHSLKPSQRAIIASVTEEIADDVFIDETARQKNTETIDKYTEEIKELDKRLEKNRRNISYKNRETSDRTRTKGKTK